jgi:NADPH:quinone reductase-like Zn-dependent oxidoreductase
MKFNLPEKMQAIQILKPGGVPEIRTMPVPRPGPGEVLIKIAAAPINPSDLNRLKDTYAVAMSYPFVPGIEGSGKVAAAGPGLIPGSCWEKGWPAPQSRMPTALGPNT